MSPMSGCERFGISFLCSGGAQRIYAEHAIRVPVEFQKKFNGSFGSFCELGIRVFACLKQGSGLPKGSNY